MARLSQRRHSGTVLVCVVMKECANRPTRQRIQSILRTYLLIPVLLICSSVCFSYAGGLQEDGLGLGFVQQQQQQPSPCCFKTIAALCPEVTAEGHSSRPDVCHLLRPLLSTVRTRKELSAKLCHPHIVRGLFR